MRNFDIDLGENLYFRVSGENLDRHCHKIVDSTLCCGNEDEELIFKNDPKNSFVPIEEFADESIDYDYPEIFGLQEEAVNTVFPECFSRHIIEPTLIEDEANFGRIICAFADAETGCIILIREKKCSAAKEMVDKFAEKIETDDYDEKDYNFSPSQSKMRIKDWSEYRHRKGEQHKSRHNNRKTMPESKIQRMNRDLIRSQILRKF